MDWLLTLPGDQERAFWQSHATQQRLQLADTLGLCFGMVMHAAVLYTAVTPFFQCLLVLTLLLQLGQVGSGRPTRRMPCLQMEAEGSAVRAPPCRSCCGCARAGPATGAGAWR